MAIFPVLYNKSLLLIYLIHRSLHLLTKRRRRAWQLTPVFMSGESHGQRSLADYSPWGRNESDMTERLNNNQKEDVFNPSKRLQAQTLSAEAGKHHSPCSRGGVEAAPGRRQTQKKAKKAPFVPAWSVVSSSL